MRGMELTRRRLLAGGIATFVAACGGDLDLADTESVGDGPTARPVDPARVPAAARDPSALESWTIVNWNRAPSPGFFRTTLLFAKGEMPRGYIPDIQVQGMPLAGNAVQFDLRRTWSDGSLACCAVKMRLAPFAANEKRVVVVKKKPGSFDNRGVFSLSALGAHDFNMVFSSVTTSVAVTEDKRIPSAPPYVVTATSNGPAWEADYGVKGFSNVAGAPGPGQYSVAGGVYTFNAANAGQTANLSYSSRVARGSGTLAANFNAHAKTATRVTKYESGPVCDSWEVWGMATDAAGAADPHLKTIWYVTVWNDGSGGIADIEYGAETALNWWSVPNKRRYNYTATLKHGTEVKYTYRNLAHYYQSSWLSARTDNDLNEGRRPWLNAVPTLCRTIDLIHWIRTGYIPPYDTALTPISNAGLGYNHRFAPLSNMAHSSDINGGGGHPIRGALSNMDVVSLMRQTPDDYRWSRNNAHAGLHIPYHFRSNAMRTRPSESGDTANTLISPILSPLDRSKYDFTSVGMPAPVDAYVQGRATDGFVKPLGGSGPWNGGTVGYPRVDASHNGAYCAFLYFLEGERHFYNATLSLAQSVLNGDAAEFAIRPLLGTGPSTWPTGGDPYYNSLGLPTTYWHGILWSDGNGIRGPYNAIGMWAHALGIVADDDVHSGMIKAVVANNADWYGAMVDGRFPNYLHANHLQSGSQKTGNGVESPWMVAWGTESFNRMYRISELKAWRLYAQFTARLLRGTISTNKWVSNSFRVMTLTKNSISWHPTKNPFRAPTDFRAGPGHATIRASDNTLRFTSQADGGWNWRDNTSSFENDQLTPIAYGQQDEGPYPIPKGMTEGQNLWVVQPDTSEWSTTTAFKVSLTKGGPPFVFDPSDNGKDLCLGDLPTGSPDAVIPSRQTAGDDWYGPIVRYGLIAEYWAGQYPGETTEVTLAQINSVNRFYSNTAGTRYPGWKLQVPS